MKKLLVLLIFFPMMLIAQGKFDGGSGSGFHYTTLSISVVMGTINPNGFAIYPNPANQMIYLSGPTLEPTQIVDIMGRAILGMEIGQTELNVSILPKGIYFVKYRDHYIRFIKQ